MILKGNWRRGTYWGWKFSCVKRASMKLCWIIYLIPWLPPQSFDGYGRIETDGHWNFISLLGSVARPHCRSFHRSVLLRDWWCLCTFECTETSTEREADIWWCLWIFSKFYLDFLHDMLHLKYCTVTQFSEYLNNSKSIDTHTFSCFQKKISSNLRGKYFRKTRSQSVINEDTALQ